MELLDEPFKNSGINNFSSNSTIVQNLYFKTFHYKNELKGKNVWFENNIHFKSVDQGILIFLPILDETSRRVENCKIMLSTLI